MILYALISFAVLAAINVAALMGMKKQVNARSQPGDRLQWGVRNGREVDRRHRALFPKSPLADIAMVSYWLCLVLIATMILNTLIDL